MIYFSPTTTPTSVIDSEMCLTFSVFKTKQFWLKTKVFTFIHITVYFSFHSFCKTYYIQKLLNEILNIFKDSVSSLNFIFLS